MKTFSNVFLLLLLFVIGRTGKAQDYPVQVTTMLTPPYSLYLSDYASPEGNAMQVMIQLRELDRPSYRVKLRLTIEGQGVTLRTKPSYVPSALVLQGGVPEVLTGADLRAYLHPDHLDFSGLSREQFMKKGTFPEGFYTFKVEVVDYVRNVVVSNSGFANAWIILNDPPVINLPFNEEKVVATDPQNVIFSWTPRHTASPNAAFTTEYEFRLVELYPANRNPNDAIRASNSIFTTRTSSTSMNYGIMEPLLIPGRRYAFRIRAVDTEGRDLFKNNGYSEVFVFQFGDACLVPTEVEGKSLDEARIKLTWQERDIHTGFSVKFRKQGTATWHEQNILVNSLIIPDLKPSTTYEYQIKGMCGTVRGEYSALAQATTAKSNEDQFSCGAPTPEFEIKTTPLQEKLKPFDAIKIADFKVILSDVTANADGSYKGTGVALMPWLKLATVRVKFNNIKVNEDFRVYSGNITTVYTKDSRFVVTLDLKNEEVNEGTKPDAINPAAEQFEGIDIVHTQDIKTISVDEVKGVIIITHENGTTAELPRSKDEKTNEWKEVRVTDVNKDTWIIDEKGTVTQGGNVSAPDAVASKDEVNFSVYFSANEGQSYGFDKKTDNLGAYDKATIQGKEYDVSWKAMETGRQDHVNVMADGKSIFPSSVGFKTDAGLVPSLATENVRQRKLFVTGKSPDDVEQLSAYAIVQEPGKEEIQEIELGRLNVKTYNKVIKKLFVVPVNGAQAPDQNSLNTEINEIYQQAVARWEVTIENNFNVDPSYLEDFDKEDTGLAALAAKVDGYTNKMYQFNKAYKRDRGVDKEAYYIFLITGTNPSRNGTMPFNSNIGYVFTDYRGADVVRAIAHEVAHGAFNLLHPFDEFKGLVRGSTDNLMDYRGGKNLKKYQWDNIHDPKTVVNLFHDNDERALVEVKNTESLAGWEYNDVGYAFMAPSGEVVLIPASVKSITFSTGDLLSASEDKIKIIPFGTLTSFNVDDKVYEAKFSSDGDTFLHYAAGDKLYRVTDHIANEKLNMPLEEVIIGTPVLIDGGYLFYTYQIQNRGKPISKIRDTNYLSAGTVQRYDFLKNFLDGDGEPRKMAAQPSFFGNQEVKDFVQFYLNKDKSKAAVPSYSVYLFTHATLLDRYKLLNNCFATGLPGGFLKSVRSFYFNTQPVMYAWGATSNPSISFPEDSELDRNTMVAFDYLMTQWGNVNVNYYQELSKRIDELKKLKIPETPDKKSINAFLEMFSKYLTLSTDNFNCLYSEIPFETKEHILNNILATDWDDWFSKYEKLIIKMLESLTDEQAVSVFAKLKGNPTLVNNAYNKMDGFLDGKYMDLFMYGLLRDWKRSTLDEVVKYPEYDGIDFKNISDVHFEKLVKDKRIILLEDEKFFSGTASDLTLETSWDNAESIAINQTESSLDVFCRAYSTFYSQIKNAVQSGYPHFKLEDYSRRFNKNPLSPVVIFISKQNATDLKLKLEPGIYAVPAILIHWVYNSQQSERNEFYLRIALEGLAIALAIPSGGASLAVFSLRSLEIALAVTDIALTLTKEELSEHKNPKFFKLYKYWDNLYTVAGPALTVVGFMDKSSSAYRIIANPKAAGRLVRMKLGLNGKKDKEVDINELADKIDELSEITPVKNNSGSYSSELKRFAASLRVNAELKAALNYEELDGFITSNSGFYIGGTDLFKYTYREGVHFASAIRYIRDFTNVKKIRFAGKLENVRHTDNGQELTSLYLVEDMGNPGSFYVVTKNELESSIPLVTNSLEVIKDYRAFEKITGEAINRFAKYTNLINKLDEIEKAVPGSKQKFIDDFATAGEELIKKFGDNPVLVEAWNSLSSFSNLRKIPDHLEVLEQISKKFKYNDKTGFDGLKEIFNGHESAQKFISNLKKAEELVGKLEGIRFSGIKSGQKATEVRIIADDGTQLGTVIDNTIETPVIGSFNSATESFTSFLDDGKSVLFQIGNEYKIVKKGSKEWFSKDFLMNLKFQFGEVIIQPRAVREGNNGKIAVIGQTMGGSPRMKNGVMVREYGVLDYSKKLVEKGYLTELYAGKTLPKEIRAELEELSEGGKLWLTPEQIRNTKGFRHNSDWAKRMKQEGYTVIDLGNPNNYMYSAYYAEERLQIFDDVIPE
jgi:hypothetical protein